MIARQYNPPKNPYHIDGDKVISDGELVNKVTGTSMAGILGCSPWSTPFTVACNLLALARENIDNKDAVKVGKALEGKIIKYADKTYTEKGTFMSADEIYGAREGDHDSWASDFEDEIFAGHVDGIVTAPDGQEYILEVKTSANLDSWANGVPEYYYWQVALYNYFITKKDKAYVVLGIVNENTYRDYASWVPSTENVVLFEMAIDQKAVEETVERVKAWYAETVLAHTTPSVNPESKADVEMFNHLVNIGRDIDDIKLKVKQLAEVRAKIDQNDIKAIDLRAQEQELKDEIRDYMISNDLAELPTADETYVARVQTRTNMTFCEEQMVADGIDPMKYKTKSITKSFTIKPIRKE